MYFDYQAVMVLGLAVVSSFGSSVYMATDPDKPTLLSNHGFTLGTAVSFVFQVKSFQRVAVRLVKQNNFAQEDLLIRVTLDTETINNNESTIKVFSNNKATVIARYEGNILRPGEYTTFRIGWKDKVISVSRRETTSVWKRFLCAEHTPLNISDIQFVTVKTSVEADWIVYLYDPYTNVTLPKDCSVQSTASAYLNSDLNTSPVVMEAVMTLETMYSSLSETLESFVNTESVLDTSKSTYSITEKPLEPSLYTINDGDTITAGYPRSTDILASTNSINEESSEPSLYTPSDGDTITAGYSRSTDIFASTNSINKESSEPSLYTPNDRDTITAGYPRSTDIFASTNSINTEPSEPSLYSPNDWDTITAGYPRRTDIFVSTNSMNLESLEPSLYTPNDGDTITAGYSKNTIIVASTNSINAESLEPSFYTPNDGNTFETGYSGYASKSMETSKPGVSKSNDPNCHCVCESIITNAELRNMIDKLKQDLKLQRNATGAYIRSKSSASDFRSSAAAVGYIGVFVLTVVAVGILVLDFPKLIQMKRQCRNRKISRLNGI